MKPGCVLVQDDTLERDSDIMARTLTSPCLVDGIWAIEHHVALVVMLGRRQRLCHERGHLHQVVRDTRVQNAREAALRSDIYPSHPST